MTGSPRPLPEMVLHLLNTVPLPPLNGAPLRFRVGGTQLQTSWRAAARSRGRSSSHSGGGASGPGGGGSGGDGGGGGTGGAGGSTAEEPEGTQLEFDSASASQSATGQGVEISSAVESGRAGVQRSAEVGAAAKDGGDAGAGGRAQQCGVMQMTCPVEELSLAPLTEALSVDNLITLWLALLMERRWGEAAPIPYQPTLHPHSVQGASYAGGEALRKPPRHVS